MTPQTIVLIGQSGCGKGTQAKLLEEFFKKEDPARQVLYIQSGALFRKFITGTSYSNRLSKEIYDRSDIQPDFLAISTWANAFIEQVTGNEHILIDGAPRSENQARTLASAFDFYKMRAHIIHLDISNEVARERLLARGRSDDLSEEKIARRFAWFDNDVVPAMEFFKNETKHHFVKIDASQPIEIVHAEIVRAIK